MDRRKLMGLVTFAVAFLGSTWRVKSLPSITPAINGVPYPFLVKDEASLKQWLSTIDREVGVSKLALEPYHRGGGGHQEIMRSSAFLAGDSRSLEIAEENTTRSFALYLFHQLIKSPHAKIVWRIPVETDVCDLQIPSDLSQVETREQAESRVFKSAVPTTAVSLSELLTRDGWEPDFPRDCLIRVSCPTGTWKLYKLYARYSIVLNDRALEPLPSYVV